MKSTFWTNLSDSKMWGRFQIKGPETQKRPLMLFLSAFSYSVGYKPF